MDWQSKRDEILRDPCIHFWVKDAIRELVKIDPIDAAVDAQILFELMDERAQEILSLSPNLTSIPLGFICRL